MQKFIFVTGGVLSGLGKGVTAASIGNILKARGYKVFLQKLDQYINIDAGTLNPGQHGEVFVTEDGMETDLDLGHYERFVDVNLNKFSYVTTGIIYHKVLDNERSGKYLGKTVQVIPHVTDVIKRHIMLAAEKSECEILISEIGGTVGDIEGLHFLEAVRQMRRELGKENVFFMHVSYLPQLGATKDLKTKPTQHSVRELRSLGILPDAIGVRAEAEIGEDEVHKIALFCDVEEGAVLKMKTASTIYEVPLILERQGLGSLLVSKLHLPAKLPDFREWEQLIYKIKNARKKVRIGLVGKYMKIDDAYLSIFEAFDAAGWYWGAKVDVEWIDSEDVESCLDPRILLGDLDGIVVPGGFGARGVEGKIKAIRYAREKRLPFLGLCFGMQLAVVEIARNLCGLESAHTTEVNPDTDHPVIYIMPSQRKKMEEKNYGATMRLGSYPCHLKSGTKAFVAYNKEVVYERHRHRYEFNQDYKERLEEVGLIISGLSPEGHLVEMVELKDHPWFVGTQAHPEFKSRPQKPHPLFRDFIKACIEY